MGSYEETGFIPPGWHRIRVGISRVLPKEFLVCGEKLTRGEKRVHAVNLQLDEGRLGLGRKILRTGRRNPPDRMRPGWQHETG